MSSCELCEPLCPVLMLPTTLSQSQSCSVDSELVFCQWRRQWPDLPVKCPNLIGSHWPVCELHEWLLCKFTVFYFVPHSDRLVIWVNLSQTHFLAWLPLNVFLWNSCIGKVTVSCLPIVFTISLLNEDVGSHFFQSSFPILISDWFHITSLGQKLESNTGTTIQCIFFIPHFMLWPDKNHHFHPVAFDRIMKRIIDFHVDEASFFLGNASCFPFSAWIPQWRSCDVRWHNTLCDFLCHWAVPWCLCLLANKQLCSLYIVLGWCSQTLATAKFVCLLLFAFSLDEQQHDLNLTLM